jgi:hypothetical protein
MKLTGRHFTEPALRGGRRIPGAHRDEGPPRDRGRENFRRGFPGGSEETKTHYKERPYSTGGMVFLPFSGDIRVLGEHSRP